MSTRHASLWAAAVLAAALPSGAPAQNPYGGGRTDTERRGGTQGAPEERRGTGTGSMDQDRDAGAQPDAYERDRDAGRAEPMGREAEPRKTKRSFWDRITGRNKHLDEQETGQPSGSDVERDQPQP